MKKDKGIYWLIPKNKNETEAELSIWIGELPQYKYEIDYIYIKKLDADAKTVIKKLKAKHITLLVDGYIPPIIAVVKACYEYNKTLTVVYYERRLGCFKLNHEVFLPTEKDNHKKINKVKK